MTNALELLCSYGPCGIEVTVPCGVSCSKRSVLMHSAVI